ncbi:hypothetical protein MTR67_038329 [Solanum verrucosum]|uniref:Late blight resistance protein n=1 Tax=Solanum verrucosum TaxID=315347 RepID=A0AAF0ZQ52_SOLVR|nr:hypothetical protein MTR67_038329 [Solanum verrucosum]
MRLTNKLWSSTRINDALDVDPGYLCLHYKKIQVKWHYYIECTGMRDEFYNKT